MSYKFLIYISYSYSVPIGKPLEEEIIHRNYTVKWFSDLDDGRKALEAKQNTLNDIQDVIDYQPDIVLTATDSVADFISGLKVQVFHGFNAEKRPEGNNSFAHFRIRGFFDLYCTQGPSTTSGFKVQQKIHPHFEVIETGWSKVDPLFPATSKKHNAKPIVMIASTFTERLSLSYRDDVFEVIKKISKKGDYKFIMVLHPKLPTQIKHKWQTLDGEHFTYFDTTDLIPLFKESDIMFSDTTSAIQEFLLQKKPVVTFNHTFDHDYLINITDAQLIETSIKEALKYPNPLMDNIANFIENLHPYYDGKSSKRVIDASIDFLHADKSYLNSKPLNLIRKYKMRKRLNYFTLKSFNRHYTIQKDSD
ncbi:MAG: UDP-N-acetylglucosamine 2-epimerase [Gelidibacter sp.]